MNLSGVTFERGNNMNEVKLSMKQKWKIFVDSVWNFPFMFLFIMSLFCFGFYIFDGGGTVKLIIGIVLLIAAEVIAARNMPFQVWILHFAEEKTVKMVLFDVRGYVDYARKNANYNRAVPQWKVVLTDGTHARALRKTKKLDIKSGDTVLVFNTLFGSYTVKKV